MDLLIMKVYTLIETKSGYSGGETVGVFTTKEKAIKKFINLNKKYYNTMNKSELKRKSKFFETKGTKWQDFKKALNDESEGNGYIYGFYATYEIKKHELDNMSDEESDTVSQYSDSFD